MLDPLVIDHHRADRVSAVRDLHYAVQATYSAIEIRLYHQLDAVEQDWRQFEREADCTAFQTFDRLAGWCRDVGSHTQPAIVTGRREDGAMLFILPLAVTPGAVRRLTWLGSDASEHNGPLLAKACASELTPECFRDLWGQIFWKLQADPRTCHDLVELTKMPERVGSQANPFLALSGELIERGSDRTVMLYDHVTAASMRGRPAAAIMHGHWQLKRLWSLLRQGRAAVGTKSAASATEDGALLTIRRSPPIAPD